MRKRARIAVILLLLSAGAARATLVRRLNLEDLIERADRVVVATVDRVAETPASAENPYPSTIVDFSVRDTLKGPAAPTVRLRQLSNRKNRLSALLTLPRFRAGESVVVFLSGESAAGMARPIGFEQGVLRIATRRKGEIAADAVVTNRLGNAGLLGELRSNRLRQYVARKKLGAASAKGPLTLAQLKEMVAIHGDEAK